MKQLTFLISTFTMATFAIAQTKAKASSTACSDACKAKNTKSEIACKLTHPSLEKEKQP
jgi:hypothetical protein